MKKLIAVTVVLAIVVFFIGCKKDEENNHTAAHVYTMSNQASGNSVIVFDRTSDGTLHMENSFATGGTGTSSALGSQGALSLSSNQNWLFAVNAGSNEVSVFRVKSHQLQLTDK